MGPKIVVMTSCEIDEKPNQLCCYVLSSDINNNIEVTRIIVNKINGYFTGTCDCCSALLLGWCDKLGETNMGIALQNTLGTIQSIIKKTIQKQNVILQNLYNNNSNNNNNNNKSNNNNDNDDEIYKKSLKARAAELSVIQCKDEITNPPPLDVIDITTWKF